MFVPPRKLPFPLEIGVDSRYNSVFKNCESMSSRLFDSEMDSIAYVIPWLVTIASQHGLGKSKGYDNTVSSDVSLSFLPTPATPRRLALAKRDAKRLLFCKLEDFRCIAIWTNNNLCVHYATIYLYRLLRRAPWIALTPKQLSWAATIIDRAQITVNSCVSNRIESRSNNRLARALLEQWRFIERNIGTRVCWLESSDCWLASVHLIGSIVSRDS